MRRHDLRVLVSLGGSLLELSQPRLHCLLPAEYRVCVQLQDLALLLLPKACVRGRCCL